MAHFLFIFFSRVLYSASFEVYLFLEPFYAYYFFNGLLIILQILHIIWTVMIARIAISFLGGKVGVSKQFYAPTFKKLKVISVACSFVSS